MRDSANGSEIICLVSAAKTIQRRSSRMNAAAGTTHPDDMMVPAPSGISDAETFSLAFSGRLGTTSAGALLKVRNGNGGIGIMGVVGKEGGRCWFGRLTEHAVGQGDGVFEEERWQFQWMRDR